MKPEQWIRSQAVINCRLALTFCGRSRQDDRIHNLHIHVARSGIDNPFVPTAVSTPPKVIGRSGLRDELEYGFQNGFDAPGRLTIFPGARGIGEKSCSVKPKASPGLPVGPHRRGHAPADRRTGHHHPGRRITAITATGCGVATALPPEHQMGWRRQGEQLLGLQAGHGTGLIFTVDEIHAAERAESSK